MARAPAKNAKTGMKLKARKDEEHEDEELEDEADELEEDEEDEDEEEDEAPPPKKRKAAPKSKKAPAKRGRASRDDEDDEDGDDDVLNLAEADEDDGEFEVLPRGKYLCTIDETEYSTSKAKGTPMITIRLEVTDGDYTGRKLWYRTFFTAKTIGRLKRDLRILTGKVPKTLSKEGFRKLADSGDMLGNEVLADVKIRTYEGDKRNEVRRIMSAEDATEEGDGGFLDD